MWFHVNAGEALRLNLPLLVVFPFGFLAAQMTSGMNRLHVLSVTSAASTLLYLLAIVLAVGAHLQLSVPIVLALSAGTTLISQIWLIVWLGPRFKNYRQRVRSLLSDSRKYGLALYVGRVFSIGTYSMDVLMVAAFTDASQVAYYNLAGVFASLVGLPGVGLSASLFPQLVHQRRIERVWIVTLWTLGAVASATAILVAHPVISVIVGARYTKAAPLVGPLCAAATVRGVTGLYNAYLMAHGKGRELRNAGIVLTASNLALNFALIPPYGAMGAAWASLGALLVNLAAHIHYYRRTGVSIVTSEDRPGTAL